jgi:hypothetical protein
MTQRSRPVLAMLVVSALGVASAIAQESGAPPLRGGVAVDECWDGWVACGALRHFRRAGASFQARARRGRGLGEAIFTGP